MLVSSLYSPLSLVPHHLQVFDTILVKCGLQCEGATAMEPLKLNTYKQPTAMTMSQQVRKTQCFVQYVLLIYTNTNIITSYSI